MTRFNDLIDAFIDARLLSSPEDASHPSGLRMEGHTLVEHDDEVAGWQNPGSGPDVLMWIKRNWSGPVRTQLEMTLRELKLAPLPVVPTESIDSPGAEVLWWAFPVECLSCMEPLDGAQRLAGYCPHCLELRREWGFVDAVQMPSIEQRRGLKGEVMPHTSE